MKTAVKILFFMFFIFGTNPIVRAREKSNSPKAEVAKIVSFSFISELSLRNGNRVLPGYFVGFGLFNKKVNCKAEIGIRRFTKASKAGWMNIRLVD
ncbi:MAG: hypothetical protein GXO77_08590 [Calditrichaeota bacterium]|nr:hypothetical protein [Calditrichota bacterium]